MQQAVHFATRRLTAADLDPAEARRDAEILVLHALGLSDRSRLALEHQRPLSPAESLDLDSLLKRRETREPLHYILGDREFWSIPLRVTPGVLIPRPDTETLVEAALEEIERLREQRSAPIQVIDVGTGSGAIAIALAMATADKAGSKTPEIHILATDVSPQALEVARHNVARHGLEQRVTVTHADLWPLDPAPDLVVSNPPYIASSERDALAPEVRDHEPAMALFDPEDHPDGLGLTRLLIQRACESLRQGGALALEVGHGRAAAACQAVKAADGHLTVQRVIRDLAGVERVLIAHRNTPRRLDMRKPI